MELNNDAVRIIRKKVDWIKVINPILYYRQEEIFDKIQTDLNLNLKSVSNSSSRYRDNEKHIEVARHDKYISIEFEGQFFKTANDFEFARNYIKQLNHQDIKNNKPLSWRVSRIDLAIDLLNITPEKLLPLNSQNFYFSFSAKYYAIKNSKTNFIETVYINSRRRFCVRAYSKNLEIQSNLKKKKGFYDLNSFEYKDREITRYEIELNHETETLTANSLINSEMQYSETEFIDICCKSFSDRKNIRVKSKLKNKSKWPVLWAWSLLKSGKLPENLQTFEFKKIAQNQDVLMRFLTATINRAEKEDMAAEQIEEAIKVALERRRKTKPAA